MLAKCSKEDFGLLWLILVGMATPLVPSKGVAMPTKISQNKPKWHRFQFCTRYGDNVCVYSRVSGVSKFKYAYKNFKGAKRIWQ